MTPFLLNGKTLIKSFLSIVHRLLKQHARTIGFIILVVVTTYGIYHLAFGASDWRDIIARWQAMGVWLVVVLVLAVADVALEAICWTWLYSRLKMRVRDGVGFGIYLSGHAGLFMPAQLGRLIRPDAIARLKRGTFSNGVKGEAALLYLDATAAVVTITGLAFYWIQPLAIVPVMLGASLVMLFLADRLASLVAGTRLSLPPNFWREWQTFVMLWLLIVGWLLSGLALYALVWNLAEGISLLETMFFAAFARLAGSGTGLRGGIGAVEGLLGISLRILEVPVEQIILAVSAYRLVTFWSLLPLGWLALFSINRRGRRTALNLNQYLEDLGSKKNFAQSPLPPSGEL